MKTKLALIGFAGFALLTIAAPHGWLLRTGKTFDGDYVSSGATTVVIRHDGTNYFIRIADLATNELAHIAELQFTQRMARLDAEAKQMRQAGWIEFSTDLIQNFPEKVRTTIPGDGTVIKKMGWMDAEFGGLNDLSRNHDENLTFGVTDAQKNDFNYCVVAKKIYSKESFSSAEILAGALNNYSPNPLVNVAFNLKRGDKIRLIGYCDDSLPYAESPNGERDIHAWLIVEKIEMIETAAEKKAREDAKRAAEENQFDSQTGLPK